MPAIPPTAMAITCFAVWLMPNCSKTAIGVSRPTKCPTRITRMPRWNRFDPTSICLRRRNCEDSERQEYCARSKRRMLPNTRTVTAR